VFGCLVMRDLNTDTSVREKLSIILSPEWVKSLRLAINVKKFHIDL